MKRNSLLTGILVSLLIAFAGALGVAAPPKPDPVRCLACDYTADVSNPEPVPFPVRDYKGVPQPIVHDKSADTTAPGPGPIPIVEPPGHKGEPQPIIKWDATA